MIKIILTGPESTGKTTLAKQLADYFHAPLVQEYARIFFQKKDTPQYNQADLTEIAKGQMMYDERCLMYDLTISPITHYPSPITHHPSPITHHPSPITHYPSPITHYNLRYRFIDFENLVK
jgi:GTPase SAR1 family protein